MERESLITGDLFNIKENSSATVCVLGRGSYGSVSLQMDSNLQFHAKKSSPLRNSKNLEKELRIMHRFHYHSRILSPANPFLYFNEASCFILMEYASKGTLSDMIKSHRGRSISENIVGRVAFQILQGLKAFHSHGYIHCDLKPSNILLFPSETRGEPWDLKLADFGISKEPNTDSRSLFPGTRQYMPPESLGYDGVMGKEVDIWSLGCVVIQMFGGYPNYTGEYWRWTLRNDVSPLVISFLKRAMAYEPSQRATATELLKHPFVTQTLPTATMRPTLPSWLEQEEEAYSIIC